MSIFSLNCVKLQHLNREFKIMSSENPYLWKNSIAELSAWTTTASNWPTILGSLTCYKEERMIKQGLNIIQIRAEDVSPLSVCPWRLNIEFNTFKITFSKYFPMPYFWNLFLTARSVRCITLSVGFLWKIIHNSKQNEVANRWTLKCSISVGF